MRRLALLLGVVLAPALSAQDALLTGRILHSSGKALDGASITLIHEDSGVRRLAWTNGDGFYMIPGVPPGMYRITVRKTGFQTTTQLGIKFDVGPSARIDFVVELGALHDSVTVEAAPYFVSTEDASVGTLIGQRLIEGLPLNGRGLLTLLETAPGVTITPAGWPHMEAGQFSVSGQRASANYVVVDGVPARAVIHNLSLFVQDTWKVSGRVTAGMGLRWELGPPPKAVDGGELGTLLGWPDPAQVRRAPAGTPLWRTSYRDFAPRLGLAVILDRSGSLVLRMAGGGTSTRVWAWR